MQWVEGRNYLQKTDATVTYCFNWAPWLNGATIQSFTVTGAGSLTVQSQVMNQCQIFVSVSTPELGVPRELNCEITTSPTPYAQTVSRSVTIEGV